MIPFEYPEKQLERRHDPAGYRDYESFRPWLRDEFSFRFVYCLRRERWEPDRSIFEIDHFDPTSRSPDLRLDYGNLLYSCSTRNLGKRAQRLPDPTIAFRSTSVRSNSDGHLVGQTLEARRLIRLLDLNDSMFVTWRTRMIRIVELARTHATELFLDLLAYPDELPDLSALRPSERNSRPDGISESHFERRQRGELPQTY